MNLAGERRKKTLFFTIKADMFGLVVIHIDQENIAIIKGNVIDFWNARDIGSWEEFTINDG
mgnify:CR=1 FL=1